jgi:hypothetical protein
MNLIFLSYHYDEPNTKLAKEIEQLVESHNLRPFTGDSFGGNALTDGLKADIKKADALVALLTKAEKYVSGEWATHQFCLTEVQHARNIHKPCIALLETGIKPPSGLFQEHEYIVYDPADPLPAFLKLSRAIGRWKLAAGRVLKLQVVPPEAATQIWAEQSQCQWQYRLLSGLEESEWREAKARKEPGGLYLYVRVPDDTTLIEVRIQCPNKRWASEAIPFHVPVSVA